MLYKAIIQSKRPLQAASHVISSTTTAAANTSSAIFSRVFVKRRISLSGTVRSLKRSAFKRSFSTKNVVPPESPEQLPGASSAAPLYRTLLAVAHFRSDLKSSHRKSNYSMDPNAYEMVSTPSGCRRTPPRRYPVPQEDVTCAERSPCRRGGS